MDGAAIMLGVLLAIAFGLGWWARGPTSACAGCGLCDLAGYEDDPEPPPLALDWPEKRYELTDHGQAGYQVDLTDPSDWWKHGGNPSD
jgi:hypothetical protein